MQGHKTTAERGKYKIKIHSALYKNKDIINLILGDTTGRSNTDIRNQFKEHVKSHLFIDDTIEDASTFIFYDINIPELHSNTKKCIIIMYLICHRSILENYSKEGYYGDRIDILSQMVEDTLINDKDISNDFGIGELTLDSIGIYNSTRFYGSVLTLSVPNFR